jgi:hypothetical protein
MPWNRSTTNGSSRTMPGSPEIQPMKKAPISSTTEPFSATSRISSPRALGSGPLLDAPASSRPVRIAGVSISASTATI